MAELHCDLLIFYATTSEREQLEVVADELGLQFQRRKDDRLGRYYALGRVGDFEVIAVRTEMGPLQYGGSASREIFLVHPTEGCAAVNRCPERGCAAGFSEA